MGAIINRPLLDEAMFDPATIVPAYCNMNHAWMDTFGVSPEHSYRFLGSNVDPMYLAPFLRARFHADRPPRIVLQPYRDDARRRVIQFKGSETGWSIMIGCDPLHEMAPMETSGMDLSNPCGEPLYHFDLVYDIFDMRR